ncbi:MAG: galactokinase [Chthoniobacteraceae bacterium]|nr:galactokinase [Chthoniobacteraceae bacterium]
MQTAYAPGRVELLGNHTDYNEGVVLSAAIDRGVTLTGEKTGSSRVVVGDSKAGLRYETDADHLAPSKEQDWSNYLVGVLDVFKKNGLPVSGFHAEIQSNLPQGAGLSSSAALEVSTAMLLQKLYGLDLSRLQIAKMCRRAENEFVGVNCGLLDQASSAFGKAAHAIFLDCRAETVETIPFPKGVELLITQCGVPHRLTGGEYNERRLQCFDAAARLGAKALRDVSSAQLEAGKASLPELSYRRAAHVVGENERVMRGIEYLRCGDVRGFGELMFASHESSRHNFENSAPELDVLVEIARGLPGVLGSRLTGGGFGGATVTLLEREHAAAVREAMEAQYLARTGNHAITHLCEIADGAR